MTPALDLSILIVNWKSKDFLRKCLDSIYHMTPRISFEVIVVDNASFDGAGEMIAVEFPQVRFIQSETNLGFARANNLAFEHSSGRVVLLLNPDTEVIGDAISQMLATLEKLGDAGILGCKLLNTDLTVQTQCIKRFPMVVREILSIEWLRLKFPHWKLWSIDPLFSSSAEPVQVDAVCGACQMIPRDVYQAVGGLSTKYFMYAEDIEISAAALRKGWRTYYTGTATIVHHGGKSSQGEGRGERWISIMQKEAHWQFHKAWRGSVYAAFYRLAIGLVSLLRLSAMAILSPILLLLRGKADFLRVWSRWIGGLEWSLGLEDLTKQFSGRAAEQGSPAKTVDQSPSNAGTVPPIQAPLSHQPGSVGWAPNRSTSYFLMTAAYNEEAYIEKAIESVLAQTHLPKQWVIVSDGSSDRTDEIVRSYSEKHGFIRLIRIERAPGRSFGSKVVALRSASRLMGSGDFDFVGNLDGDISVEPSYFGDLIARFEKDPRLGIAGGFVRDRRGDEYESNSTNRVYAVAHGAQLVRRECFEAIGGYAVLEYGGEDWHAQISAMMKGWTAESFPDLYMFHHRPTGEADRLLRYKLREGRMDHSLGSDPLFELFKCLKRIPEKPFLLAAAARFIGFAWSSLRRDSRPVSDEFVAFVRKDQRERLSSLLHRKSIPLGGNVSSDRIEPRPKTHVFKRVVKLAIAMLFFVFSWIGAAWRRLVGKETRSTFVILCYHDVSSEQRARFGRQMDVLSRHAKLLPLDFSLPLPVGERYAAVTFDDALASFTENALPELESRMIPVALFVVTGKLGQESDWEHYWEHYYDTVSPIMTSTQLKTIADKVMIGSHTVTHPMLSDLSEADVKRELKESRTALERIVGRDVTLFSFPYGDFSDDSVRWCAEVGYKRVFTMLPSLVSSDREEFVLGRVSTEPTDWPLEFRLKLLGAYHWLPFAFAVKYKILRFFGAHRKRRRVFERAPQQGWN